MLDSSQLAEQVREKLTDDDGQVRGVVRVTEHSVWILVEPIVLATLDVLEAEGFIELDRGAE